MATIISSTNTPSRGELWLVRFDPAVGAEIQKVRPAVVLNVGSVGRLPLCIVAPITDWKPRYANYSWLAYLQPTARNGLVKESAADAFQVKSLSHQRFVRQLGRLEPAEMDEIAAAVALCVGYI